MLSPFQTPTTKAESVLPRTIHFTPSPLSVPARASQTTPLESPTLVRHRSRSVASPGISTSSMYGSVYCGLCRLPWKRQVNTRIGTPPPAHKLFSKRLTLRGPNRQPPCADADAPKFARCPAASVHHGKQRQGIVAYHTEKHTAFLAQAGKAMELG